MKKVSYLLIVVVGILYSWKLISTTMNLHSYLRAMYNPNEYVNSLFKVFLEGKYFDIPILLIGIIGLLIRNRIGFALAFVFPIFVYVYTILFVDPMLMHEWKQIQFVTVIAVLLVLPWSRAYFNLTSGKDE